jgi:hypothetical protein
MANAPDTLVITGSVLQQVSAASLLLTPTGGTQDTLGNLVNGGTVARGVVASALTVTALANLSANDAVSTAGSTQATATPLTANINNIATVTAGQGVNTVASAPGMFELLLNTGTATITVYPFQAETLTTFNGAASSIALPPGAAAIATASKSGTIETYGINPKKVNITSDSTNTAHTLAASAMTSADVLSTVLMTGSLAGGAALTLPTVAQYMAALPFSNLNSGAVVRIVNQSAGAASWTLTNNGSFVTAGTSVIAQGNFRDYAVIVQNSTSVVATDIGGGILS